MASEIMDHNGSWILDVRYTNKHLVKGISFTCISSHSFSDSQSFAFHNNGFLQKYRVNAYFNPDNVSMTNVAMLRYSQRSNTL